MAHVVGVDGWKSGWIAVVVDASDGAVDGVIGFSSFREPPAPVADASIVVVDIPIGLPLSGRRQADSAARRFVGPRASSVFPTLPRAPLEAPTYQDALALSRRLFGFGISAQSYALRSKILELAEVTETDRRITEGHPETSFTAINGSPLQYSKKVWNGITERRRLLAEAGIHLADDLPPEVGSAPPDDVIDSAVMAWTALRVDAGSARCLPDPPEIIGGREVAIWY